MEKVLYVLWRDEGMAPGELSRQLRGPVADALFRGGARGLQVNVADDDVDGALIRLSHDGPSPDAIVGLWLDSAIEFVREECDDAIDAVAERWAAYLVTESEPLCNDANPSETGARTYGFANLAFLRRPADLEPAEWLHRWHDLHTAVAIEGQSTFRYVQHVVVRQVAGDEWPVDGIVEECFPPEALTDLKAFFGAADDDDLAARMAAMGESVSRFGADRDIDVVPTSQYVLRRVVAR
jgi:hypothetical protein